MVFSLGYPFSTRYSLRQLIQSLVALLVVFHCPQLLSLIPVRIEIDLN